MPQDSSGWIVSHTRNSNPRLRIICFPHAGASAQVFYRWREHVPPDVSLQAVQLPGRGIRTREKLLCSIGVIVHRLLPALEGLLEEPFVFFGHSMGALIAFETARNLRRTYHREPCALFVSGAPAPHLPSERGPMHDLPDPEFRQRLAELNGTPRDLLEDAAIAACFWPILRADLEAVETYHCPPGDSLSCPIHCFAGSEDPEVSYCTLVAWRLHTAGEFRLRMFSGDHFFLNDCTGEVVQSVLDGARQIERFTS